jgi:hypothetical protein
MADDPDDEAPGATGSDPVVGAAAEPDGSDGAAVTDGETLPAGEADDAEDVETADMEEAGTGPNDAPRRPRTGWERLSQTFMRPASPQGPRPEPVKIEYASMTDEEKRARITQIDPMERKVGLAAAALAAVFALVYTIPYMVSKISVATTVKPVHDTCIDKYHYVASTNTCNTVYPASHYTFPLVLWLVFAIAIYVTVRIGRRAPMAFAIVLTGLAFGTVIIMLPFVVGGAWLLLRAYRTQKYGAPTARAPVEGYVRPPPRSGRGSTRGTGGGGSGGGGGTRNASRRTRGGEPEPEQAVRRPPTASKRYTPKAAPKGKARRPS